MLSEMVRSNDIRSNDAAHKHKERDNAEVPVCKTVSHGTQPHRCHSCARSLAPTHTIIAGRACRRSSMPATTRRPSSPGVGARRAGARRAGACACLCAILGALPGVPRVGAARHLAQANVNVGAPAPRPGPPPAPPAADMLLSQSAPTCTVQLDAVSANGGESVTGKLRMYFPTDSSAEESYMIAFTEKPMRDAIRVPNDILVGDLEKVYGDIPPNVALTGATIVEGGDMKAVNMIFVMVSGAAEASESDDPSDASPSVIEYAFTQPPAHQSASIFPPGNLTADATTILGCGLLIDCE